MTVTVTSFVLSMTRAICINRRIRSALVCHISNYWQKVMLERRDSYVIVMGLTIFDAHECV